MLPSSLTNPEARSRETRSWEIINEVDRKATVEAGIFAIKTTFYTNGGAIVALLALLGADANLDGARFLWPLGLFALGLIFAVATVCAAYVAYNRQAGVSHIRYQDFEAPPDSIMKYSYDQGKLAERLAILSLGLFVIGIMTATFAFSMSYLDSGAP